MIVLDTVSKYYPTRSGPRRILDGVTTTIGSGERIGILGRNGSGKSTLLRLLSGAEQPSAGSITRTLRVSWPLAFGGPSKAVLPVWIICVSFAGCMAFRSTRR